MHSDDMREILTWLFEAANLHHPHSKLDLNQPASFSHLQFQTVGKVGDNKYLLFSSLLKTHLSEKDAVKFHKEDKKKMVAELQELARHRYPCNETVGAFLFTCFESGN
jgi:hypothetical protein